MTAKEKESPTTMLLHMHGSSERLGIETKPKKQDEFICYY